MKSFKFILAVLILFLTFNIALEAQTLRGMGFNGATGLYTLPTGRIGWSPNRDFGLDFGYHMMSRDRNIFHIPKVSLSLLGWLEISGAFDIKPYLENSNDFLLGGKIAIDQFINSSTALAIGGNIQFINISDDNSYRVGQIYIAATYAGNFFNLPAETTLVLGYTIYENSSTDIDFGMGFDIVFLPTQLNGMVRWVTDFSNHSYSYPSSGIYVSRGIFNTGLRIDLSRIPVFRDFKFLIDLVVTDALDASRALSFGFVFGIPVM